MNKDLEKIKNMLAKISFSGDQDSYVLIEENDPLATLRKAKIKITASKDWFAFNPDKILSKNKKNKKLRNIQISPLLTSNGFLKCSVSGEKTECHHNKTCDAVIFLLEGDQLRLIFIELKSSLEEYKKAMNQIKSAEKFSNYLLDLACEFSQVKFKIIPHYILLYKIPARKTKTDITKITPTKSLFKKIPIYNDGTIFLRQLIQ